MAFQFQPKIVIDGLVLYLDSSNTRSYISGGTSWNDLSKSCNNGTVYGCSYDGSGVVFDGIKVGGIYSDYVILNSINFSSSNFTA